MQLRAGCWINILHLVFTLWWTSLKAETPPFIVGSPISEWWILACKLLYHRVRHGDMIQWTVRTKATIENRFCFNVKMNQDCCWDSPISTPEMRPRTKDDPTNLQTSLGNMILFQQATRIWTTFDSGSMLSQVTRMRMGGSTPELPTGLRMICVRTPEAMEAATSKPIGIAL